MQQNHDLRVPVELMTDSEIVSAIRYLDPDCNDERSSDALDAVVVFCVSLVALLAGTLAFIWLYFRVS